MVALGLSVLLGGATFAAPAAGAAAAAPDDLDFRVSTFPLRRLADDQLPYHGLTVPPLPPDWQPTDDQGITMSEVDGRLYYHPLSLADKLIRLVAAFETTGRSGYLDWARKYATKVREIGVVSDGALFVPYRFDWPRHYQRAPWFSGMAQGMLIMGFVRLFEATGDARDLLTAHELFRSFQRAGPSPRPWVSRISDYGYLWIEEYPHDSYHDRVLNGLLFTIYGLYDYWRVTDRPVARRYLEGTLTTLREVVLAFRVPGGISLYCLRHRRQSEHYHEVHIRLLRNVGLLSGSAYFGEVSDLFYRDHAPPSSTIGRRDPLPLPDHEH